MTVVPMAIKAQAFTSCNCLFKRAWKQISKLLVTLILQARKYHLALFTHKRAPGATCGCSSADTAWQRHSNAPVHVSVCVCTRACVRVCMCACSLSFGADNQTLPPPVASGGRAGVTCQTSGIAPWPGRERKKMLEEWESIEYRVLETERESKNEGDRGTRDRESTRGEKAISKRKKRSEIVRTLESEKRERERLESMKKRALDRKNMREKGRERETQIHKKHYRAMEGGGGLCYREPRSQTPCMTINFSGQGCHGNREVFLLQKE